MFLNYKAVDYIFKHLRIKFGENFNTRFGNVKFEELRDDWANTLLGLKNEQLRYGYEQLINLNFCPTADQFKKLCLEKKEEDPSHKMIRFELTKRPSEKTKEQIKELALKMSGVVKKDDHKTWAYKIIAETESGGRIYPVYSINLAYAALAKIDTEERE
jgi:hypothetical protein